MIESGSDQCSLNEAIGDDCELMCAQINKDVLNEEQIERPMEEKQPLEVQHKMLVQCASGKRERNTWGAFLHTRPLSTSYHMTLT